MNLFGTLSFDASGKTLKTGGTLTLKSTDADTARIADITSNATISGNVVSGTVTIERYIISQTCLAFTGCVNSSNRGAIHKCRVAAR